MMGEGLRRAFAAARHTQRLSSPYRYLLTRLLRPELFNFGVKRTCVLFIGFNPSTADEQNNDPTVRRMIGFAERLGAEHMEVVNLFAWRCTDPSELPSPEDEAVGPENDATIRAAVARATTVIACWGGLADEQPRCFRARDVYAMCDKPMFCFGMTSTGAPKHPLYLKKDAALVPFKFR